MSINTDNEVRFLYTICPKKPIKNLNESIPLIRVSRSLFLTKDEVLKCLDCGSVYRRFSNEGINEKINKYEVERVHREKYISKEDWNKLQADLNNVNNLVVNGVTEAPQDVVEEKVDIVEQQEEKDVQEDVTTKEEEAIVDASPEVVIEETIENEPEMNENEEISTSIQEESTNDEIVEDTVIEEENIEAVEEDSETEEEVSTNQANNNIVVNYNGKKKKHH